MNWIEAEKNLRWARDHWDYRITDECAESINAALARVIELEKCLAGLTHEKEHQPEAASGEEAQ